MKDVRTWSASKRFIVVIIVLILWPKVTITAEAENNENVEQEFGKNFTDDEEFYEQFYEWSIWSPCSRTCGIGIKFRGQLCLRENKALCEKTSRIYETCNTQPCPQGSVDFRDAQCGEYNGRDIFINGGRAKWMSYIRGDNQCLLFCYPYGQDLFYYFGRAKDGTQCSKDPYGVCVYGRCKPVGCDNKLESGVYMDKCRVCGGNSATCKSIKGKVERSPTQFERLSGYAKLMVIPKGSTSVFLTDATWNYLALRRRNGEYVVNGNRIVSWSGMFKVGDMEVNYKRLSSNIKETIQISGPTNEDLFVMSLLITGKLNITFEYWIPAGMEKVLEDAPRNNLFPLQMSWGSWTACSATCGGGIKVRFRYRDVISFSSLREKETEVKKCNIKPCDKMEAAWSEWGPWDDCSATCGGGARIRFRYCKKPRTSSARTSCPGKRYAVEQCNVEKCPEQEIRTTSTKIEGYTTVTSSQEFRTQATVTKKSSIPVTTSTFERKSSSEMSLTVSTHYSKSPNIVVPLQSQTRLFQYRESITGSSLQDLEQKTFWRVEEGYPTSSTLSLFLSFKTLPLEPSSKQSHENDVSRTTHKEVFTFPGKSQRIEAEVSDHEQKPTESSVKESVNLPAGLTAAPVQKLSNSIGLPGLEHSTYISATQDADTILSTISPSPVVRGSLGTSRQFKSLTHSVTVLQASVRTHSDVLSVETVSDYEPVMSSTGKESKSVRATSSKSAVFISSFVAPGNVTTRDRVAASSRRSSSGGQISADHTVSFRDKKDSGVQPMSTRKSTPSFTSDLIDHETFVTSATSQELIIERISTRNRDVNFTSHERKRINASNTIRYSTKRPDKTRHVATEILPTPFLLRERTILLNSSLLFTVDHASNVERSEVRSLKPIVSSDYPLVFSSRSLSDTQTEETRTLSRHKTSRPGAASGAKITSLIDTLVEQSVQSIPAPIYKSSAWYEPYSTMPLKNTSILLNLNQTTVKSLEPRMFPTFESKASLEVDVAGLRSSMHESKTSEIESFKTTESISNTTSRTAGKTDETYSLLITASSARDEVSFTSLKSKKHIHTRRTIPAQISSEVESNRIRYRIFTSTTAITGNAIDTKTTMPLAITLVERSYSSVTNASSVYARRFQSKQSTRRRLSADVNLKRGQDGMLISTASSKSSLEEKRKGLNVYLLSRSSSLSPHMISSVSTLRKSKLFSVYLVTHKNASLPSSTVIDSSTVTGIGYLHLMTSPSQVATSNLKGKAIIEGISSSSKLSSTLHTQSSVSTFETSKLLPAFLATQVKPSPLVSNIFMAPSGTKSGYVYSTTSSYTQSRLELKREALTNSSSRQRIDSLTLTAEASKLSNTHLASDFNQSLSASIDTQEVSHSLPTELRSTLKEEATVTHDHSSTIFSSSSNILSSTLAPKPQFIAIINEMNSTLSLSRTLTSSGVTQRGFVYLATSSLPRLSSSEEVNSCHEYSSTASFSRQWNLSSMPTSVASKGPQTYLYDKTRSPLPLCSILKSTGVSQNGHRSPSTSPPLRFNSAPEVKNKTSMKDSLTTLVAKQQMTSLVYTLKAEGTTTHLDSSKRFSISHLLVSSMSPQLTSILKMESSKTRSYPLTSFPQNQQVNSFLSLHFGSAFKGEETTSSTDNLTVILSRQSMPSSTTSQSTSTLNIESSASHIFSLARTLSTQSVYSIQSRSFSSALQMEDSISNTESSKISSSRQGTLSLKAMHLSSSNSLQATPTLLGSPRFSSSAKAKDATSLVNLSTIRLSSKHKISPVFSQFSSTLTLNGTESVMDSTSSSSSRRYTVSSISSQLSSTLNAKPSKVWKDSLESLQSKYPVLLSSPVVRSIFILEDLETDNFKNLFSPSLSQKVLSSPSQAFSSPTKAVETKASRMDSATISSSMHELLSSLPSIYKNLTTIVEPTISLMVSLSSSSWMQRLHSSSAKTVEPTKSHTSLTSSISIHVKPSPSRPPSLIQEWKSTENRVKSVENSSLTKSTLLYSLAVNMEAQRVLEGSETRSLQSTKHDVEPMRRFLNSLTSSPLRQNTTKSLSPKLIENPSTVLSVSFSLQFSSPVKAETKKSPLNSLQSSSSRQYMLTMPSLQSSLTLKERATTSTSLSESLTISSLGKLMARASPHFTSALKVESTRIIDNLSRPSSSNDKITSFSPPRIQLPYDVGVKTDLMYSTRTSPSTSQLGSQSATQFTITLQVSVGASSPRLKLQSLLYPDIQVIISSAPEVQTITSGINSTRASSSMSEMPSLAFLQTIAASKVNMTSLMDSKTDSLTSSLQSTHKMQSLPSPQLSSTHEIEITGVVDSLKTSVPKYELQLLPSSPAISASKKEIKTKVIKGLLASSFSKNEMTSSSSPKSTGPSSSTHVIRSMSSSCDSSTSKANKTISLTDSTAVFSASLLDSSTTFLSNYEMASLSPTAMQGSSAPKVKVTTNLKTSSPSLQGGSLSKERMKTTSRLTHSSVLGQATKSLSYSSTVRSSRQHKVSSIFSHFRDALKAEVPTSILYPSKSSSSTEQILSFISTQFTSTLTIEATRGVRTSFSRSSSSEHILLSVSPKFRPTLKVKAMTGVSESSTSSPKERMVSSMFSQISSTREAETTSIVSAPFTNSWSGEKMPSSPPPQFSLSTTLISTARLISSLKRSTSKQRILSSKSPHFSSVQNVAASTSYIDESSLSRKRFLPSKSPQSSSEVIEIVTTSQMVSFASSLPKQHKPLTVSTVNSHAVTMESSATSLVASSSSYVRVLSETASARLLSVTSKRKISTTSIKHVLSSTSHLSEKKEQTSSALVDTSRQVPALAIGSRTLEMQVTSSSKLASVEMATVSATTAFQEEKKKCSPCENLIKRTRAYCTSDFVIHVEILSEAINEFNHDTRYRVRVIHTFKLTSEITTVRSVWIFDNLCRCPLLVPGKQYLLMGHLGMLAGSTESIAEINRQSYVEEWRGSMLRRLPDIKKRCPLNGTKIPGLVTNIIESTTVPSATETRTTTETTSSEPLISSRTPKPPVKCRSCRVTKKRNKSYCESDFVIQARILEASFNETLHERKYPVRVIKIFKSAVDLKVRENIFVVNDQCRCPKLELREQYVIMGTMVKVSITDTRLLIPSRPYIWKWRSRMEDGLKSITCDN